MYRSLKRARKVSFDQDNFFYGEGEDFKMDSPPEESYRQSQNSRRSNKPPAPQRISMHVRMNLKYVEVLKNSSLLKNTLLGRMVISI